MKAPGTEKPSPKDIHDHVYAAVAQGKLQAPLPDQISTEHVTKLLAADHLHGSEDGHQPMSFDMLILEELNLITSMAVGIVYGKDSKGVYHTDRDAAGFDLTPSHVIDKSWRTLQTELKKFNVIEGEQSAAAYLRKVEAAANAFVKTHYPALAGRDGP